MSDAAGRLESIWIKRGRGGPMDATDVADLREGEGIVGNANQGGRRQVTVLSQERWNAVMREVDGHVPPAARRANLLVTGIDLEETRGRTLRVGPCRILIAGETKPCDLMEETLSGLRAALRPNWGGGAYGQVLDSGQIRVGDEVRWEDQP
jgi:MOSC domain-containing protein YiiM